MERRQFIKTCVALPALATILPSCGAIYYAKSSRNENRIVIAKSEFLEIRKNKTVNRVFVLVESKDSAFPICLYRYKEDNFIASLLKCTHRGCELNVGGGIYSCPCHGSEFSIEGKVLEGPADRDLITFKTKTDHENIYIFQA